MGIVTETKPIEWDRLHERILLTHRIDELPAWVGDMLGALGQTDCCQSMKPRKYLVEWNGHKLIVWECNDPIR